MESHLLQMRGLKLVSLALSELVDVASFTDAWIETSLTKTVNAYLFVASFTDAWIETDRPETTTSSKVASFTDAWIETPMVSFYPSQSLVASFTDAWIETVCTCRYWFFALCRIFYRCVD